MCKYLDTLFITAYVLSVGFAVGLGSVLAKEQIQVSKRYYPSSGSVNDKPVSRSVVDNILERFHVNTNTIIRTQDSRALGAQYLNETELSSNEECLYWCWETSPCNLAVFEEKSRGSCYLFDCGSNDDFRCKFTPHNFYTSSILRINRHSYDLSQWGSQAKHESDLVRLRSSPTRASGLPATPRSPLNASATIRSLITPTIFPSTTTAAGVVVTKSSNSRCQHYQFACRNNSDCIAIYNVCDGIPQCSDGSDEATDLHCPQTNYGWQSSSSTSAPNAQQVPKPAPTPLMKALRPDGRKYNSPEKEGTVSRPSSASFKYPKAPDAFSPESSKQINDPSSVFGHKFNGYLPANRYEKGTINSNTNNNNNNNQYRPWNQYYPQQSDFYNVQENRAGYVPENDYMNNYARENSNANSLSYWPPNGQRGSYEGQGRLSQSQGQGQGQGQNLPELSGPSLVSEQWSPSNMYNQAPDQSRYISNQIKNEPNAKATAQEVEARPQLQAKKVGKLENLAEQLRQEKHQEPHPILPSTAPNKGQPILAYSNLNANKVPAHVATMAISRLQDSSSSGRDTNSAVIALSLGLCITAMLVGLVGCRMKSIRRRIARRGRSLAHDADYLVNGMYL